MEIKFFDALRQVRQKLGFFERLRASAVLVFAWIRALARAVRSEGLDYRATSLAYTTLLAIVPGLALCFSLLKAFGVHNQLEPFLLQMLAPLGDKADELTQAILGFVTRVNVGVLGFVGLMLLIYTIISVLEKIEAAFNHIWRVTRARSLARRTSDYLSVILLGPVLIFSAIGLTASMPHASVVRRLIAQEPFGTLFYLGGKLLPYLMIITAFAFVYIYIPNTRVPWRAALFGGAVGGVVWKLAGLLFAQFVVGSTSYHAIYSSLVIVILFMIWLDLSWLILLIGGQAAFYFQHPYYVRGKSRFVQLGNRLQERLGLAVMYLIGERFVHGGSPWTIDALAERLSLPWETVKDGLSVLQAGGLVAETGKGDESFFPARDIAGITVWDILMAMRTQREDTGFAAHAGFGPPELTTVSEDLENAAAASPAARRSLRDLVLAHSSWTPQDSGQLRSS
ncbi:ribonuclease BN-like family protein [Methylocaldum marinum]|uniref:Ribonuclease BN-like family protein n=1 Tax=Methylocaldum marinum TaxID=1432792 RepID=A0A250KLQ3_9GAMM|nr:YihY/virulence factor BrkB family protein [Methylocaldum marinum]BBA32497.1 ribonuclease BN-like family protein [Methylocaldum marinum]